MARHDATSTLRSSDTAPNSREQLIAACLALIGGSIATYLSLYQYGVFAHVWEPFFGQGSVIVLNYGWLAPVSRMVGFAIHDAPFGVIAYLVEAGLALTLLRRDRVRTHPWVRVAYAATVLALGLGSMGLVVAQAFVLHAWCTLCLISAAISEIVVFLSHRDIVVVFRGLRTQHDNREKLRSTSQNVVASK